MEWYNYSVHTINTKLNEKVRIKASDLESTINAFKAKKEHYHCLYDLEKRESYKGYKGFLKPVFESILVDFDSKDENGIEEDAWAECKDFCKKLEELGCPYQIYFSGNKGFHVVIPMQSIGIFEQGNYKEISKKVKGFLQGLKTVYSTVDPSVADPSRKIRAYKSLNTKSGLYKIRLTDIGIDPFVLSLSEIKVMATEKQHLPMIHPSGSTAFDWLCGMVVLKPERETANQEIGRNTAIYNYGCAVFSKVYDRNGLAQELLAYDFKHNKENPYFLDPEEKHGEKKPIEVALEMATRIEAMLIDNGESYENQETCFYARILNKNNDIVEVPLCEKMGEYFFRNYLFSSSKRQDYKWKEKYWIPSDNEDLNSEIQKLIKKYKWLNDLWRFNLSVRTQTNENRYEWKDRTGFLNFNNGIYDINTGNFIANHDPTYRFFQLIPIEIDKEAKCPKWEKFLTEIFADNLEKIDLLQDIFGYCLFGGRPFLDKAFVFIGGGRNGKGTVLKILQKLIGKDSYTSNSLDMFSKENKFDISNTYGKLVNITPDQSKIRVGDVGLFKAFTAGDDIKFEAKGKDAKYSMSQARLIVQTQHLPEFGEKDTALKERLVILKFAQSFTVEKGNQNNHLFEELCEELPGILNWSIEGAKNVLKTRSMKIPKESIDMVAEHLDVQDPFEYWFEDNIGFFDTSTVSVDSVYWCYKSELDKSRQIPLSAMKFSVLMKNKIRDFYKNTELLKDKKWRHYFNGKQKRCFYGIIIKNPDYIADINTSNLVSIIDYKSGTFGQS